MRKARFSLGLLLVTGLVLAVASSATAGPPPPPVWAQTYTWALVESPGALGVWPNEANSPNIFEADEGLLGRVVVNWDSAFGTVDSPVLDPGVPNSCELAPSYPCLQPGAGGPPVFLFSGPPVVEGPIGSGIVNGSECNKHTNACGPTPIVAATHLCGPGTEHEICEGEYSYFVIHREPTGKGIGFFTGSFMNRQALPNCNGCPPMGRGKDKNSQTALSYTIPDSIVETVSINIWTTQSTPFVGHDLLNLINPGTDAGQTSLCGNGITFQDVGNNLCSDGLAGAPNFTIPDQKVSYWTYSVNMANHANFNNPNKCSPPDCYVQRVIIPAAMAQAAKYPAGCTAAGAPNPCCTGAGTGTCGPATNVQVQKASSVLPPDAPANLQNATVDTLIFAYTTQLLDLDGDGVEDPSDPCPADNTDFCIQDLINGGNCPAGQVFCADFNGDLGCLDAFLCDFKLDVNNDCLADGNDENTLKGFPLTGVEAFASTLFIGPFNP